MRRLGVLGACLAAVSAVAAMETASASAEAPEYGRCVNVAVLGKAGAFKNAGCTVKATVTEHKFEWESGPGSNPKFVSHMTSEKVSIETASGTKVSCTHLRNIGKITGPKTTVIQFVFEGCAFGGAACTTPGQAAGAIVTPVLPDKLIMVKREPKATNNKIGDDVGGPAGAPFAEFECGPAFHVLIAGSWIWPVKTNAMLPMTTTLKFSASKGVQKPSIEKGEGEPKDVLEASIGGGPFERVGFSFGEMQENEETIEVNSVV